MADVHYYSQVSYYFKDSLAYTEDHVLVTKLYLFNMHKKLDECALLSYFNSMFGNVADLKLFRHGRAGYRKSGYVRFKDARSAASALHCPKHNLNGLYIHSTASDSWRQPDAYPDCEITSPQQNMQANIMMLNDDCFRVIFEMLSHVDRIKFARVCARFRDLYQDISPSLYKSVNCEIFQTMTLWEIRDFFTLSGCNIQQIRGSLKESSVRICTFMGWHCVNLKLLDISLTPLTLGSTYRLLSNLYYLESLRLDGCNLRNENLLAMRHLKQLKELDISRNYSLNGANMDQFPSSIESLTLTNCYNLLGFALPDFCSSLTNLKKMDIRGLVGIYASLENLINKNICTCLEELVFSDPAYESDYDHIAKLPSLKRITIQYEERYSKNSKFLYRLARHKANQLEYLEVIGANCITADDVIQISKLTALRSLRLINQASIDDRGLAAFGALKQLEQLNLTSSIHITNNGVLQLLLNCPKLQEVYVQHCRYLTDDLLRNFVRKAPEKVKNQHVLPIKLYIYGCKITEIGLHNDKVASKKYLDVSLIAPEYSLPDLADLLQLAYISDDEDDFLTDSFNSYDSDTPDSEFDHYDLGYIDYH